MASLLRQQGHTTACVGKWHLGNDLGETKDIAADNPEVVAELEALMERHGIGGI